MTNVSARRHAKKNSQNYNMWGEHTELSNATSVHESRSARPRSALWNCSISSAYISLFNPHLCYASMRSHGRRVSVTEASFVTSFCLQRVDRFKAVKRNTVPKLLGVLVPATRIPPTALPGLYCWSRIMTAARLTTQQSTYYTCLKQRDRGM